MHDNKETKDKNRLSRKCSEGKDLAQRVSACALSFSYLYHQQEKYIHGWRTSSTSSCFGKNRNVYTRKSSYSKVKSTGLCVCCAQYKIQREKEKKHRKTDDGSQGLEAIFRQWNNNFYDNGVQFEYIVPSSLMPEQQTKARVWEPRLNFVWGCAYRSSWRVVEFFFESKAGIRSAQKYGNIREKRIRRTTTLFVFPE